MNIKTIRIGKYDEVLYKYQHQSGLNCFVIPKKGYYKKHATFATYYGSIDNEFVIPGETASTVVPDGIAHFLEHKLFEQKDGSVMDKFAALGSRPNAFTSFNQTAYLFSCTDEFPQNFELLLNFVQNPYITQESVEKEKDIIGQEINMYQDDPGWRVSFNLLDAFYKNHPVKLDIAGSIESISKIDRELLYKCYNTFYHPSNMVIIVVGDVDYKDVFSQIDKCIKPVAKMEPIKRIFKEEGDGLNKHYNEKNMPVSTPLFYFGFKDLNFTLSGVEKVKYEIAVKLLLQMLIGKSSELYTELYEKGLINSNFEMDFLMENSYAHSMIGGESNYPEKVRDSLAELIERINKQGLNLQQFNRVLKASKGRYLKLLNSPESITRLFINAYFKGVSMFDYLEVYDTIGFDYVEKVFKMHFDTKRMALSVVKQKQ